MRLLVFDLDGTLTATDEVDTRCFVEAFAATGFDEIDTDWGAYEHTTDSGIATEIFAAALGRPPHQAELESLKGRLGALLEREASRLPSSFEEIAGASVVLEEIAADSQQCAALATGAWAVSAEIKLAASGFGELVLPSATSDDAISRVNIVERAIDRARDRYRIDEDVETVLIGDGAWDVRVAQALGYAFVGVASERGRERLSEAGAAEIVDDYRDTRGFFAAVERAVSQSLWKSRSSKLA